MLPLNIELAHWPIEKTPQIGALLNSATLQPEQKEELLKERGRLSIITGKTMALDASKGFVVPTKTGVGAGRGPQQDSGTTKAAEERARQASEEQDYNDAIAYEEQQQLS